MPLERIAKRIKGALTLSEAAEFNRAWQALKHGHRKHREIDKVEGDKETRDEKTVGPEARNRHDWREAADDLSTGIRSE